MSRLSRWYPYALFATLLIAFIGFSPVFIYGENDLRTAALEAGGGENLTQIAFASLFVFAGWAAWREGGLRALGGIPIWLAVVLAWCVFSIVWAVEPTIAGRRTVFCVMVCLSTVYLVQRMEAKTALNVLAVTCIVILGLDWIALEASPMALHQEGGAEPGLVGTWRGAHSHKNGAGAFCASSIIVFCDLAVRKRSYITAPALALLAFVFLIGTESKTSLGFLGVAVAAGLLAEFTWRHRMLRYSIMFVGVCLVLVGLNFFSQQLSDALALLDDPGALTGRSQIWPIVLAYIGDHPLSGAGYGSFWAIGENSPVFSYATGWVAERVDHAHNGYLNLAVQIGLIGLALAVVAVVVMPLKTLFSSDQIGGERVVLTALLVFAVLRDLLEDSLVDRANPIWIIVLMVITLTSRVSVYDVAISIQWHAKAALHSGPRIRDRSARM